MRSFLPIFLLLLTLTVFGQTNISGQVVDAETGEALIGAHVYLLKNWRKGTTTDVNGRFQLQLEEAEMQDSLVVTYLGFEDVVVPVGSSGKIAMTNQVTETELITISATPLIAEEFKYSSIKKLEIYTNPAAQADPILAVNSLPSATTLDESANLSLRGGFSDETGIFLNNVPIHDAVRFSQLNGIGTFSIFNTSIIEEVTVYPGNPPLEYGNASSGVVSLSTDSSPVMENTNSVILSLANIGISREQRINDNQSLKLFTNWQPSAAIKAVNEEALEEIESFESGDLGIYWYGNEGITAWKTLVYGNLESYDFAFESPSYSGTFRQQKSRLYAVNSMEIKLNEGLIGIGQGWSMSRGNYAYSSAQFEVNKLDWFSSVYYFRQFEALSIKTGISSDNRRASISGQLHTFDFALDTIHPLEEVSDNQSSSTNEWFGYVKYFLSDEWAIGSGIRSNAAFSANPYLSRQLNLSYTRGAYSVILGAGRYHMGGIGENSGDPIESANNQVSLDLKHNGKRGNQTLSFFHKRGEFTGLNYRIAGAEFFAEHRFSPKFRGSSSITLLHSDSDEGYPYTIRYFVRGNFSYTPGRLWTIESILIMREGSTYHPVETATWNAGLSVFEPVVAADEQRLANYSQIGISISKIFPVSESTNLISFASANNLFDTKNTRSINYSNDYSQSYQEYFSRRAVYFGVIINFK